MQPEEREKREDENHNRSKGVHVVVSNGYPPPRKTTIAIRADLIEKKGIRKLDL